MGELLQRMSLGLLQQLQQQENTDKEHHRSKYNVEEFLQLQKLVLQLMRVEEEAQKVARKAAREYKRSLQDAADEQAHSENTKKARQ
jgi:hypothetical protein